jgi:hypothetical protein
MSDDGNKGNGKGNGKNWVVGLVIAGLLLWFVTGLARGDHDSGRPDDGTEYCYSGANAGC